MAKEPQRAPTGQPGEKAAGEKGPAETQARETTAREQDARERAAQEHPLGGPGVPAAAPTPTQPPTPTGVPNTAGGPGSQRSEQSSGAATVGPRDQPVSGFRGNNPGGGQMPTREVYNREEDQYGRRSVVLPGSGESFGQTGGQPRQPGMNRTPRFGVIASRPERAAGGELTLADLAETLRQFNAAVKARDWWGMTELGGELLVWGAQVGRDQFAAARAMAGSHEEYRGHEAGRDAFNAAAREFEAVRADAVGFAPQMHRTPWHQSGGPVSGAPLPDAPRPAGSLLNPQSLLAILEAVSQIVQLIRGATSPQPGA